MHGTAHISFTGGGVVLPAHTPYDRQLLFEHVEASARQHHHVELSAKGRHWGLSRHSAYGEPCVGCNRAPHGLIYRCDGLGFCGHCVRRALN
jgi:hypothetical protein